MKIVTADQMRQIEERSEKAGVSPDALMENAGLAIAGRVRHHLRRLPGKRVIVLVGPGNNGGDGLVVARHLHAWGADVIAYLCLDRPADDPKLAALREQGAAIVGASSDEGPARLHEGLKTAHMVVDAVLGTGRSRPIGGGLRDVLIALAEARGKRPQLRLLALDMPSGIDADTGTVDPACVAADATVTLGYPKAGLYKFPAAERAGKVEVVDIGVPRGLDDDINLELMTVEWARSALPSRPLSAHKGTFGRVLAVAGSRSYVGAAYLAAIGAARAGAGLVTLALPESLQMGVAAQAPEPTYLPLPESSPGVASAGTAALILESVDGYDSLLVGCGMGQAPATVELLERLLFSGAPLPATVVDADGLNFLARSQEPTWWDQIPARTILTPHPGEMARLRSRPVEDVETDRVGTARESAAQWDKVVVLKGSHTVVAFPSGKSMVCPWANPGLATAGTGDVLAGAMAGLLAQGVSLEDGAALGVYLHAVAGEIVKGELGETGMLAGDVARALPLAIKQIRSGG